MSEIKIFIHNHFDINVFLDNLIALGKKLNDYDVNKHKIIIKKNILRVTMKDAMELFIIFNFIF